MVFPLSVLFSQGSDDPNGNDRHRGAGTKHSKAEHRILIGHPAGRKDPDATQSENHAGPLEALFLF